MTLWKVWVERDRTIKRFLRSRQTSCRWIETIPILRNLHTRKIGPSEYKIRIQFHRFLVRLYRTLHLGLFGYRTDGECSSAQISVVGAGVFGWSSFDARLLLWTERRSDRRRNFGGQLPLLGKRIGQHSVIVLRPHVAVGQRIDQLH